MARSATKRRPATIRITNLNDSTVDKLVRAGPTGGLGYLKEAPRPNPKPVIASNYAEYLRSPHWRRIRKRYKRERGWKCYLCSSVERLELHHKTYERLGYERLDDLELLCQDCHVALHQLHDEGQISNLDSQTLFSPIRAVQNRANRISRQKAQEPTPKKLEDKQKQAQADRERLKARTQKRTELMNELAKRLATTKNIPLPEAKRLLREQAKTHRR